MEGLAVDFSSFIDALTGVVTPAQILAILASCVGVGFIFVLMWLGVRKITAAFTSALMRGRLRV